jgi:hypothetical protein
MYKAEATIATQTVDVSTFSSPSAISRSMMSYLPKDFVGLCPLVMRHNEPVAMVKETRSSIVRGIRRCDVFRGAIRELSCLYLALTLAEVVSCRQTKVTPSSNALSGSRAAHRRLAAWLRSHSSRLC